MYTYRLYEVEEDNQETAEASTAKLSFKGEWEALARLVASHTGDGHVAEGGDVEKRTVGVVDVKVDAMPSPPGRVLTESDAHGPPVHSLSHLLAVLLTADQSSVIFSATEQEGGKQPRHQGCPTDSASVRRRRVIAAVAAEAVARASRGFVKAKQAQAQQAQDKGPKGRVDLGGNATDAADAERSSVVGVIVR